MLTMSNPRSKALWVGIAGVLFGILAGVMVGAQPLYLGLGLGAICALIYFFADFERAVLGLLILRSALDNFSLQQIPAAYAVGLDTLTLLYVTFLLLTSQTVKIDKFWWVFASWIMLQGLWLVLSAIGGLGLDASYLPLSLREWIRLFSWLLVYLLVMQLEGRIKPEKLISILLLSLIIPVAGAVVQIVLPPSWWPSIIANNFEGRVYSTLGHPNTFASYLSLFIGLVWWKFRWAKRRWPWLILLSLLAIVYVSTRSLTALFTIAILILILNANRLNLVGIMGGFITFFLIVAMFASTEAGQKRLNGLSQTPLLNPNIDVSRAVLSSIRDSNSFNWRLSHWNYLIKAWQNNPILGYGIATGPYLSPLRNVNGLGYTPHNDYIRFLVEQGVVGFMGFIAFLVAQFIYLFSLMKNAAKGSPERNLCLILIAIWLSFLINMSTNNALDGTTFFFYWWTVFAVAGWNIRKTSRSDRYLQDMEAMQKMSVRRSYRK